MTCIIVFVLHANNADVSEMPFPNNTNYTHLGGKPDYIFNSLISLIGILTTIIWLSSTSLWGKADADISGRILPSLGMDLFNMWLWVSLCSFHISGCLYTCHISKDHCIVLLS